jgi:hypothetical protein
MEHRSAPISNTCSLSRRSALWRYTQFQGAQGTNLINHPGYDSHILLAFTGRNKLKPAPGFFDTALGKETDEEPVPLYRFVIAFLVMAVTRMAPHDNDTVGAVLERGEHELGVDAPRAHEPDDPHIRGIRALGRSSLVGAGIGAPIAQESDNAGLKAAGGLRIHASNPLISASTAASEK